MARDENSFSFDWKCRPDIEELIVEYIERAKSISPQLSALESLLISKSSTYLLQWLEALFLPLSEKIRFIEKGYQKREEGEEYELFYCPLGHFPLVIFSKKDTLIQLSLAVEDASLFLLVHGISSVIEGSSMSSKRSAVIFQEKGVVVEVSERRGEFSPFSETISPNDLALRLYWKDRFRTRKRYGFSAGEETELLKELLQLAEASVISIGNALAASLFLEVEREFWQSKNRAGQIQFARQNALGMGWANHDHHTFRSSRRHFNSACAIFEALGFECRERFYAGKEAGWGAQVLEHPRARGVIFLDVDLRDDEVEIDFAHEPLHDSKKLGTIGLWCGLHGESLLNAGMHHLEAQFSFDRLKEDLSKVGIDMMAPFSSFPYLKQAFTQAEQWKVDERRVERLLNEEKIGADEAARFLLHGAKGSHLENLERKEGYKGFNKKNVSLIIKETDPRKSE